ncbi:hypothetical protein DPMN_184919 [Dreissena polymorpha]|uniref:Uncharacterized protein n=1 Tax=Dreissena polymorpha TaxID=45954 RepID=A0A9D4I7U8_DREPO|nr:hypothetical protein DPMN_184919 [Dreissena polymorpha]
MDELLSTVLAARGSMCQLSCQLNDQTGKDCDKDDFDDEDAITNAFHPRQLKAQFLQHLRCFRYSGASQSKCFETRSGWSKKLRCIA